MPYVLNPKNGRVFKDGPGFAKIRGLVRISDADADKITGLRVSPSEAGGSSVDADSVSAAKKTVVKAVEKREPTVSIVVPGDVAQGMRKTVENEASAESSKSESSAGDFGGLTKDKVTVADVVAVADDKLAAFSNTVLNLTQPPKRSPAEIREQIIKIVGRLEEKRAKADSGASK
jgi:hypothetical protein